MFAIYRCISIYSILKHNNLSNKLYKNNFPGLIKTFVIYVVLRRRCWDGTESQKQMHIKEQSNNKNESDSLSNDFEEGRSLVMWGG